MTATRTTAGTWSDAAAHGDPATIEQVVLAGQAGISATILTFGAALQALVLPDRDGRLADVVLGHDDAADYVAQRNFFNVTLGRCANRIADGRFALDGETYQLSRNDGDNALHGGVEGFDRRNWRILSVGEGDAASVVLALHSPDGEGGYPGAVDATVTYTLDREGALSIAFHAETTRPTIINMTTHSLLNLAGEGSPMGAMAHRLTIPATHFTPVDAGLIPTGERRPVAGTPFDFTSGRIIGDAVRDATDEQIRLGAGYDHNFALDAGLTAEPKLAARLEDPGSGRALDILSTEPGLQFYSGNFLDGTTVGKGGRLYRMGDGIALEPQKFPDAPNQPSFVSVRVDPGQPYRHVMVWRPFTVP